MIGIRSMSKKFLNGVLALLLVSAQLFAPLSALVPTVSAAQSCVVDTAGANDEPNQKDLTQMCVDYDGSPTSIETTWNWDDLGTSGANTLDACNLFDTDADGKANYATCVTTQGDPATIQSVTTYECNDSREDRCAGKSLITNDSTSCTVNPSNDDPFTNGDVYPQDIKGACEIDLSSVGGINATLIDVCSYPSQQPNSDPSDCVVFIEDPVATVEVIKSLSPTDDTGLFNLYVDGPSDNDTTTVNDVGHNGTTGAVSFVIPGNGKNVTGTVTVGELAGTNTNLAHYDSSINCYDRSTPAVSLYTGTDHSLQFSVSDGDDIVCVITNTAGASITIVKNALPNNLTDFDFTTTGEGVSNFTLDDDNGVVGADNTFSNQKKFDDLGSGSYTFTEDSVTGWDLTSITCSQGSSVVKDLENQKVTINLSAGQDVTCRFENKQRGQIIVTKQTLPDGDNTEFPVTISTENGAIHSTATQKVTDGNSVTYTVGHGTYDVNEDVLTGWAADESECQDLTINGNTPLVNGIPTLSCTITNTKLAVLIIIKNALPDHTQDFTFTTTGTGLSGFSLDDDDEGTLSNKKEFKDLTPNQQYTVTEQSTPGWELTDLICNDAKQQGRTATVTPTPGQTITCTFTNTKLVSISGTKFEVDADATDGGLGTVLAGWTIFIDTDGDGELDANEQSDVTDINGNYSFSNLLYGTTVTLREVLQAGWTQIFGPSSFTIDSAEDVENLDFGNFADGSISGYKWNDLDGEGDHDENEPKLTNWTIRLYRSDDNTATGNYVEMAPATTTDANGNYTFDNLSLDPSRFYSVCEDSQSPAWEQTYPETNGGCHFIELLESGKNYDNNNFGNQGRGNITVKKHVDLNGDGDYDDEGEKNSTDWNWNIDGSGNYTTGSTQPVAAGTYQVSEVQQTDFHLESVRCSGERNLPQNETVNVTVSPGENVVCVFVNARDTGTIEVIKQLNPVIDSGVFDLQINGITEKEDAENGDTTGAVSVITGSTHSVGELAGNDSTDLNNYDTTLICTRNDQVFVDTVDTELENITVNSEDTIVCTFTNTRRAQLTVVKDAVPNDAQDFHFTINEADIFTLNLADTNIGTSGLTLLEENPNEFDLDDDADPTLEDRKTVSLAPGLYTITEDTVEGWDLHDINCGDLFVFRDGNSITVLLEAGSELECTFVNHKRSTVTVTKYNDYDRDGEKDDIEPTLPGWEFTLQGEDEQEECIGIECLFCLIFPGSCEGSSYEYFEQQTTDETGTTVFTNLKAGVEFELSESQQEDWTLSNIFCGNGGDEVELELFSENQYITPRPGENIECFVGNYRDAYLLLDKSNNRPDPTTTGDIVTYTLTVTVPEDSNPVYNATVTDLPPEGFEYIPGSWTATKGSLTSPYSSPGTWTLGDLYPGEVVVLTYQTKIADNASAGTYPDIAFAEGCSVPASELEETCTDDLAVLSNVSAGEGSPFVGTDVTIRSPQVLAATRTVLVETGAADMWRNLMVGTLLLGVALATLVHREKKGGRA